MCHERQLFGAALLLCLLLAAAAACAETKVFVRVDYTGTVKGDAPEARVCLAAPLEKNEPYREYGTRYDLSWLTFASVNMVYKYGRMGSSVVWMLPVSARNGDVALYLDLSEVSGLRSAYLNGQPLSHDQPVSAKLSDILVFKFASGARRSTVRLVFTTLPVVSVTAKRSIGVDSNTKMKLQVTDPDYRTNGWKSPTLVSDGVISKRGKTAARYSDKHPYSFSVMKDGRKSDVRLAGLRQDSDWILDSAYNDASRFRNRVAMDLWDEMYRLPWKARRSGAVAGTPVEVYINDRYRGVFILNEKQDRKQTGLKKAEDGGTGQIIKTQEENDDDNSPAGFVSLGRKRPGSSEPDVWYNVRIKYPDIKKLSPDAWTDFYDLTNLVIKGTDEEFAARITDYLDLNNLAKYYVLVSALGLSDNMRKNMVFVRAEATGKFSVYQLIPWDMDAGYGRAYTSRKIKVDALFTNRLFRRLIKGSVGGFNELLCQTWQKYGTTLLSPDRVMSLFEGYVSRLRVCGADRREMEKHPVFRFYMDHRFGFTLDFDRELNYIRDYLNDRWSWCDQYFKGLAQ